jgi:hypothetical protein
MRLVVVDTWEGPCAVGHGECRVCGWSGLDAFDVGLVPSGDDVYELDEAPEAVCPACGLREVEVDLTGGSSAPASGRAV